MDLGGDEPPKFSGWQAQQQGAAGVEVVSDAFQRRAAAGCAHRLPKQVGCGPPGGQQGGRAILNELAVVGLEAVQKAVSQIVKRQLPADFLQQARGATTELRREGCGWDVDVDADAQNGVANA